MLIKTKKPLAFLFTLFLLFSALPLPVLAAEGDRETVTTITAYEQTGTDGSRLTASILVTDKNGVPVPGDGSSAYNVYLHIGSGSSGTRLGADGTAMLARSVGTKTAELEVWAEFRGLDGYAASESERFTLSVVKPTLTVSHTDAEKNRANGAIAVDGDWQRLEYYPTGGAARRVEGTLITGLAAGTYYVSVPFYRTDDLFVLSSANTRVVIGEKAVYHNVTLTGEHAVWLDQKGGAAVEGPVSVEEGAGTSFYLQPEAGYLIRAVTAEPADGAKIAYDPASGKTTVTDVSEDVTLTALFRWQSDENDAYTVTLTPDARVTWSRNGETKLRYGTDGSVYLRSADADRFFIEGVTVSPEGRADVVYFATGEVLIRNLLSDIVLTAVVTEKQIPQTLEAAYEFVTGGNYSETNPAVKVRFSVTARDALGVPVPGVKIWFKEDVSGVSYTQARQTDSDGAAVFTETFLPDTGAASSFFIPVFSLTQDFSGVTLERPLAFVPQRSGDLVLYENQIIAATPGESNGKVIGLPETYELYTGEIHQGAIVYGGEWIKAENGEIGGLSAGQHALRAGERADYETDTFYLKSDYAVFTVPRGQWVVTVDAAASEGVVFPEGLSYVAEPGGTVYVYAEAEAGYEITGAAVNRPGYVSGGVRYEEEGYVTLEGVTGNVTLTVLARRLPEEPAEEPQEEPQTIAPARSAGCLLSRLLTFIRSLFTSLLKVFRRSAVC